MAIRTYKVTLDSKNTIAPEPVFLRQGDKTGAVVIDATLMDNGSPVSLDGLTPMFKANTADGQAVIADSNGFNIVNASGGEFTYQVPSQLGSVPGKIKIAYFSFSDSSGAQSTFNVFFVVEKAADMNQESANDWVSNLNDIINQYNQWVNDAHSSWQDFINANKEIIESVDPGGALLTEVIDARRTTDGDTYETLGKRLDGMEKSTDYTNQVSLLQASQAKIKQSLEEYAATLPSNTLNILLFQDMHYSKRNNMGDAYDAAAPLSLGHVNTMELLQGHVDAVVVNGDNVHGNESKAITTLRNHQVLDATQGALFDVSVLATIGNHDDNSVFRQNQIDRLTLGELEDIYGKTYSYQDFPDHKVRVILLSGFENPEIYDSTGANKYGRNVASVFTQTQLEWLATDALKVPNDYAVLIFNHSPFLGWYNNVPYDYMTNVNHDLLKSILLAFVNGSTAVLAGTNADFPVSLTADFSAQGKGTLIGCVFGHEHRDAVPVVNNGITGIERTCNIAVGSDRTIGDLSEYAFDVIQIDTSTKTVTFKRFGAGADATIKWGDD